MAALRVDLDLDTGRRDCIGKDELTAENGDGSIGSYDAAMLEAYDE